MTINPRVSITGSVVFVKSFAISAVPTRPENITIARIIRPNSKAANPVTK